MRKIYFTLSLIMLICFGCEWQLKQVDERLADSDVTIERFDRIESHFLTTGDRSALQQMNTNFPMQTRTLIEDVLKIGHVNDADINTTFHTYFQDSILQRMIADVAVEFADMDDVTSQLSAAFSEMKKQLPLVGQPTVYTQIGSFDQSIIVGHGTLGISLDKYLGKDYPFYVDNYDAAQRIIMTRNMIVPDCLSFYLLSQFPPADNTQQIQQRHLYMGKIQWVVNKLMRRRVFRNSYVSAIDRYMQQHPDTDYSALLNRRLWCKNKK